MMTCGALGVMWMDKQKIPLPLYGIIYYHEHQTCWVVVVCHGVSYVNCMGTDMNIVPTCRKWLRSQQAYIAPSITQLGTRIRILKPMICFKKKPMMHILWKVKILTWCSSHRWYSHHLKSSIHCHRRCSLFHHNQRCRLYCNRSSCRDRSTLRHQWLCHNSSTSKQCTMFSSS